MIYPCVVLYESLSREYQEQIVTDSASIRDRSALDQARQDLKATRERCNRLELDLSRAPATAELDNLRSSEQEFRHKHEEAEQTLQKERESRTYSDQKQKEFRDELRKRLKVKEKELDSANSDLIAARNELDDARSELEGMRKELDDVRGRLCAGEENVKELEWQVSSRIAVEKRNDVGGLVEDGRAKTQASLDESCERCSQTRSLLQQERKLRTTTEAVLRDLQKEGGFPHGFDCMMDAFTYIAQLMSEGVEVQVFDDA